MSAQKWDGPTLWETLSALGLFADEPTPAGRIALLAKPGSVGADRYSAIERLVSVGYAVWYKPANPASPGMRDLVQITKRGKWRLGQGQHWPLSVGAAIRKHIESGSVICRRCGTVNER